MVIVWNKEIRKRDKDFMIALIMSINPSDDIVTNKKKLLHVVNGWHTTPYNDSTPHFNIRYPPSHKLAGSDIHVHSMVLYNQDGSHYFIPYITY